MKKLAFIFVLLVLTQMNLYGQTYCPVSFPGGVAPITSVKFGAVNNSSATVSTTAHELFTSTIDTIYGGVIELVVRGNTGGNFTDSITAYFDWNSDGDFLDTFEVYHIGTITNSGGNNLTEAAIALIPTYNVFSSVDTVRMRIVKKRGVSGSSCNTSGIGQAEDYDLCFIGSFPCAGTPNAGIASVSSAYLCNNTAFVLSLSGYTFSHSHSWQWQESPKGLNIWTNISGATTPTFIVQGITSAKDYMIIATCANAGGFDISNVVSVSNSYASFTNNSPVCVGDTINVAMNPCPNCSVSIFGPGGFSDSQSFSLPNVTLAQKGWYTFTTSDSFCNTTSALDSFYLDVSNCQDSVWPGDVNLDFITNYLDVLYSNVPSQISNAHQGPARKNATINYVGQACPDWSTSLNNVNRKHSDCDGNGTINLLDTIAISQNYSLLHPKGFFTPKPKITAQADLYFDTTGIKFLQNTTISIPVVLGSVTHPINNFFGLGAEFKINSPQLLGFSITDTNSILGTTQQQLSFKKQIGNAQMDLVYSRLYYAFGVNGYGPLFNVVLSLPPNSAGDTVTLYFDNERLIDHTGDTLTDYNIIPLTFVIKDPLSIKETNSIQSASIIPNPSGKKARLDLKLTQKTSITVTMTDITGKHIWQWAQPKQHSALSIELPEELTAGLYFISVKQEGRSAKVLKWIKQ